MPRLILPCRQCHDMGTHRTWCSHVHGAERKVACYYCKRPPGGVHTNHCRRSRASQRALAALDPGPRTIYPHKGFFSVRNKGGLNPGVPRVCSPKPRGAGGMPKGIMEVPTQWRDAGNTPHDFVTVDRARVAEVFLVDWGMVGREVKITGMVR